MIHKINIVLAILAIALTGVFFNHLPYFWVLIGCILSLFLLILSIGILFAQFQYFYPAVYKNQSTEVVLTFDDGPDNSMTPSVLAILKKHQIAGIFFIVGNRAKNHPELIKQMVEDGHVIGNHTQHHSLFFAMYSRKKIAVEIDECMQTIQELTGKTSAFFRPPIGYMNPSIAAELKKRKLCLVSWNVRSFDTLLKPQKLLTRLVRKTKPGSIVILHDNLLQSAEILDQYIQTCLLNGIIFANPTTIKNFSCA